MCAIMSVYTVWASKGLELFLCGGRGCLSCKKGILSALGQGINKVIWRFKR